MNKYMVFGGVVVLLAIAGAYVRGMFTSVVLAQTTQPSAVVKTKALTYTVKDIDGKNYDLSQLKGKVVLIVNVASQCGFTKQYPALEALYRKHKDEGFVIVGFPANDFGAQEPGTDEEIKTFCTGKYNVTFPIMSKVVVKGDGKCDVYKALTEGTGQFAGDIKWNFTKFLIAKDGETIVGRFASAVKPEDAELSGAVESALAAK